MIIDPDEDAFFAWLVAGWLGLFLLCEIALNH